MILIKSLLLRLSSANTSFHKELYKNRKYKINIMQT